ncbi:MAG: flap endonuclease [Clostridia bacterium]|nr:flap endonuclease [Clostridia bacterium]
MDKLLLVDGSNLLFQMFFGMPSRIVNKQGKQIQGTLGFTGALLKIIKRFSPTHVLVLFDGEHHNERKDVDQNYKANRVDYSLVDESENPFSQLDDIYKVLDYLKIKRFETTVCETDDLIASYSLTYGQENKIIISSFDSDFFQLITDNVIVFRYRGDNSVICDKNYLLNKFNISPDKYADFKSLTGDSADNIKGARGIGPKRASELINKFGCLNNLINCCNQIEKQSIKDCIQTESEHIKNNYKIIKLSGECCLPFRIEELNYLPNSLTTKQILTDLNIF